MNTTKISLRPPAISDGLFSESTIPSGYLWKNLVNEKKDSHRWLNESFKASFINDFWSVFSSPLN